MMAVMKIFTIIAVVLLHTELFVTGKREVVWSVKNLSGIYLIILKIGTDSVSKVLGMCVSL